MRRILVGVLCVAAVALWVAASQQSSAQQTTGAQQAAATVASTVDRDISAIEKQVIEAADAMPDDKFMSGTGVYGQSQTQNQAPQPAASRADEMLRTWNAIGNKLVAMAQDFPEDKYDFKVQKDERTFALNLLHAAALDFVLIRMVSGSKVGPDFGEGDNPTRDQFKTKADVVKFVQEAVANGARVIQEQGDAGLDKTTKLFGNRLAHNSYIWTFAIEHSAEHYGQLVVYYRANNLVPPDSRPR